MGKENMKVLYTDRIRLRNFCRQDINDMYEFCSQSEIEMVGWSAHRIEEIINEGKIIRPAYKAVAKHKSYVPLDERK